MDHINIMRHQLKYFEVQLQFNPGPAITADIQAGRLQTSQDIDAAIAKLETTKNSRGDVINHKSRHRKTRLSTTHQQLPNLQ
ncbi:hypothetical protein CEXT_640501 [Caerostris extrusa]|uniref:Uncharacterized protein n=1 Tax=Caerostris extrusa TaxID=172846 RepID=A0AAV4X043_CAEEX|nr:hypothetical protein CEXT_640501 [Caerostris extrusa]